MAGDQFGDVKSIAISAGKFLGGQFRRGARSATKLPSLARRGSDIIGNELKETSEAIPHLISKIPHGLSQATAKFTDEVSARNEGIPGIAAAATLSLSPAVAAASVTLQNAIPRLIRNEHGTFNLGGKFIVNGREESNGLNFRSSRAPALFAVVRALKRKGFEPTNNRFTEQEKVSLELYRTGASTHPNVEIPSEILPSSTCTPVEKKLGELKLAAELMEKGSIPECSYSRSRVDKKAVGLSALAGVYLGAPGAGAAALSSVIVQRYLPPKVTIKGSDGEKLSYLKRYAPETAIALSLVKCDLREQGYAKVRFRFRGTSENPQIEIEALNPKSGRGAPLKFVVKLPEAELTGQVKGDVDNAQAILTAYKSARSPADSVSSHLFPESNPAVS